MEEVTSKSEGKNDWRQESSRQTLAQPKLLEEIEAGQESRMVTPDEELNRVLGGGIVSGSVVLIGGEPGIGKSTLMLQTGLQLNRLKTLYVSGEESEQQIKIRAGRIAKKSCQDKLLYTDRNQYQEHFSVC